MRNGRFTYFFNCNGNYMALSLRLYVIIHSHRVIVAQLVHRSLQRAIHRKKIREAEGLGLRHARIHAHPLQNLLYPLHPHFLLLALLVYFPIVIDGM